MKKRILSMILMLTMIVGIFTGCGAGAGGSANEITVSEMLDSILEEKGEVVFYQTNLQRGRYDTLAGNIDIDAHSGVRYDGKKVENDTFSDTFEKLYIRVDDDGNVLYEDMSFVRGYYVRFGAFSREEINGKSYMVFSLYKYAPSREDENVMTKELGSSYVLIEDTEYTIDKTIVFDKESDDIVATPYPFDKNIVGLMTWDKNLLPE